MILRNVTVTAEPQVLGLKDGSSNAPLRSIPERRVPNLGAVPPPPPVPVLTLETVKEWLAAQPAQSKAACAAILAPELTALRLAAQSEGLELGRAQGQNEMIERAGSSLEALTRIAAAAENSFALEAAQLADGCIEIVAEIFFKLAGPHLVAKEAVHGAVLAVLSRIKDERKVTIRVCPADLPLLQAQEPAISEALGSRRWTLMGDPRVMAGGCLVDSTLGTLDGRLEVQLSELCETLRAAKTAQSSAAKATRSDAA